MNTQYGSGGGGSGGWVFFLWFSAGPFSLKAEDEIETIRKKKSEFMIIFHDFPLFDTAEWRTASEPHVGKTKNSAK